MRYFIPFLGKHLLDLLCGLLAVLIVIQAQDDTAQVWVFPQISPQPPFVQPAQRDRIGDHLPV